ncbi:MAG: hypothetical protein WHX52_22835 [Anaerolineae bacterium]
MTNKKWLLKIFALQLLFLSLSGGLLLYWNIFAPQPSQAMSAVDAATLWTGTAQPVVLAEAEMRARHIAHAWAGDATLSRVEATWRPVGEWTRDELPPAGWSFYYYSPAQSAVMAVAVKEDKVLSTPATNVFNKPATLEGFPPTQDASVAWLTFRAAGGERFLKEHPGAAVQIRLQKVDGRLAWFVLAFTPEARFQVRIDAETGQLQQL